MTGPEFIMIGKRLYGRSAWQGQLADALGINPATVWRYSRDKRPIPAPIVLALEALLKRERA